MAKTSASLGGLVIGLGVVALVVTFFVGANIGLVQTWQTYLGASATAKGTVTEYADHTRQCYEKIAYEVDGRAYTFRPDDCVGSGVGSTVAVHYDPHDPGHATNRGITMAIVITLVVGFLDIIPAAGLFVLVARGLAQLRRPRRT